MEEALTFEKVWAALMENREQMKETDRKMQETDRQMKETDRQLKETGRYIKSLGERFGELSNRFGEMAEHLVAPNIVNKFRALGLGLERVSQNSKIVKSSGITVAEVDLLLESNDLVVAVEVKTKPTLLDVDKHIARMETLRREADLRGDARKYRGAIAAAIMIPDVREQILASGFYAIEQSGDTMQIVIPEGFIPREW